MNRCDTLKENLKAYLDGELPPVPRTAVRLHLARCASCREEIRLMEQIGNDLRAGDAGSLEPSLRAKLLSGIPDTAPGSPTQPKRFARFDFAKWKRKPMMLWGAAAAAVLVWFAFQVAPQAIQHPVLSQVFGKATGTAADSVAADTQTVPPSGAKAQMEMSKGKAENSPLPAAPGTVGSTPLASQASGDLDKLRPTDRAKLMQMTGGALMTRSPAPMAHHVDPFKVPWHTYRGTLKDFSGGGMQGMPGGVGGFAGGRFPGVPSTRQVHREADITVEVAKLEETSDTVEQMVKTAGGYVANNEISTGEDGLKSASLTTKIPVAQFDLFLGKVSKLGDVKAKNVTGEDVTEQISDEAQAKRVLKDEVKSAEDRLQEARTRSQRREDMETISDLKVQRAQAAARLEMLNKSAALSDVTVQLREKAKPAVQTGGGFLDELSDTGHAAVLSFMQAARLPILLLVWLVAYAPIWIVLAIAYRYAVRS